MRYQFSPSRNQTRIIHDDGRVETVEGRVGADGGASSAPAGGQFYDPAHHPVPQESPVKTGALALADGATARFTDELGAVVDTAGDYLKGDLGGVNPQVKDVLGRYEQNVARNRVELERGRRQNPEVALPMEVAGGFVGPLGRMRGMAGAVGAGVAYGVGDSVGKGMQVVEDGLKGGVAGGALGYVGSRVAPKVGGALEKGAHKALTSLSKPAAGRRLASATGVGNAIGTGVGGLVGGPVGGMMGSAISSALTPRIAKGVSGLAKKGATALEHRAARRALAEPHAILTHENPRFAAEERASAALLRDDILKAGGGKPQGITGRYDSPDTVEHGQLSHGLSVDAAVRLGKKFGQESVVASGGGNNALIYSQGENAGKAILGKGTSIFDQEPAQFYSTMKNPLSGKPTHFSHNLDFDAGPQSFDARKLQQGPAPKGASAGGAMGAGMALAGGGASDMDPATRRDVGVRQKLAQSNGRHLTDKLQAGKLNQPTHTDAMAALQWVSRNVKNPYFAKQAMEKIVEEPQSAKTIVQGLQEGMKQSGQQEDPFMWSGRFQ